MKKNENEIFIDGKNQAIQILQNLNHDERTRLLGLLKAKNPLMAQELEAKSFSFMDLLNTNDRSLQVILEYASAPVVAISISNLEFDNQKRVLKLLNRSKAETAYKIFKSRRTSTIEAEKAQLKILNIASELIDRGIVIL